MAQEKYIVDGPKVIDFERVENLKVSLIGGQVDIIGHDEVGARVEVHSVSGRDLKITLTGDTLEVDHPQLSWDNFLDVFRSFNGTAKADVSIMVPRDVALKFGVVNAKALITGLTEDATISTVNGDVTVDGHTGELKLNTVNGEIAVRDHTGSIGANTVSGDITASGAITRFAADGVSGDVFLDLTGVPDEVLLNTVTGKVTARLAADVAVQYRINTVAGRIQLDNANISGVRGQYSGTYGTLEKHWLDFRANSVSGSISVLHSVSA